MKISYGFAELGISGAEVMVRYYLLIFYTDVVGLSGTLTGIAVALALLWDAITDPLMGMISDQTSSRWGKRRPYMFVGCFALGLSVIVVFNPPMLSEPMTKFFYLLGAYILFNTAMTILSVPYSAMGGEITKNPNEVSEIFGWRLAMSNGGMVLGAMLPGIAFLFFRIAPEGGRSYGGASILMALLVVLSTMATLKGVHQKNCDSFSSVQVPWFRYGKTIWTIFQNKLFVPLFVAYLIGIIGVAVSMAFAIYYYKYALKIENQEAILTSFTVAATISIYFWITLSRKLGKIQTLLIGIFMLGLANGITYLILPEGNFWLALLGSGFVGFFVGSTVLLDSLLVDAVDYEGGEQRRLGLYFGFWKMGGKVSRALALAGTGIMLDHLGFQANQLQSLSTVKNLIWIYGPGVGICFLIAALIAASMLRVNRPTLQPA